MGEGAIGPDRENFRRIEKGTDLCIEKTIGLEITGKWQQFCFSQG